MKKSLLLEGDDTKIVNANGQPQRTSGYDNQKLQNGPILDPI